MQITSQISPAVLSSWAPELASQYSLWYQEIVRECWDVTPDILERHPQAVLYQHGNVVFPILHGKAIVAAHVEYHLRRVFVQYVGFKKDWCNKWENAHVEAS